MKIASPYGKALVLAWPGRAAGKAALRSLLEPSGIEYEIAPVRKVSDISRLSAGAVQSGTRYLISVGSDQVLHRVVNGMMSVPGREPVTIGVVPAERGSNFIRTFGLPPKPEDAVTHLGGEPFFEVDCGKISFENQDGSRRDAYFANVAEVGLGAEVIRRAGMFPRFFGRAGQLLGFWFALGLRRSSEGEVWLKSRRYSGRITNLIVANAQFSDRGMRIAPKAHPADGKFDVLIQRGNKRSYVAALNKQPKGEHIPSAAIREYLVSQARIETDTPLPVAADGVFIGFGPASFEIVSNAYRLKI